MKLTELEPYFLKRIDNSHYLDVPTLQEADGVVFLCPKCFLANNGSIGTHSSICWFTGHVPDDCFPTPGRWNPRGSGFNDLTFVGPGATSVLQTTGCKAHYLIQNGEILLC